jgi:hypothetical protein
VRKREYVFVRVCACVCLYEKEREKERKRESVFVRVCACVCVRERERESEREIEKNKSKPGTRHRQRSRATYAPAPAKIDSTQRRKEATQHRQPHLHWRTSRPAARHNKHRETDSNTRLSESETSRTLPLISKSRVPDYGRRGSRQMQDATPQKQHDSSRPA